MVAFSRAIESGISSDLRKKTFAVFQIEDYWKSLFQGTSKKTSALKRSTILTEKLLG